MIEIFLHPGEYYIGNEEVRIRTVLGSCVSVTLWHPKRKIGGMSHFILPERGHESIHNPDGRYGEESMWLLLKELIELEVPITQCQAKIFGGGNMFPQRFSVKKKLLVGEKNGHAARQLLRHYGIPIVSENLFGIGHRQIIFDIASGDVWVRQTQSIVNGTDSS